MNKPKSWLEITKHTSFQSQDRKRSSSTVEEKSIKFKDISVKINNTVILDNVIGEVKEGEILALMGPSGSGKTTLLNVLSQRFEYMGEGIKKSNIVGELAIDNVLVTKEDKKRIGYVMQTEYFFESLTLKETILFHARMRISSKISEEEKIRRAMDLIEFMNLQDSINTNIGGPFIRGLSNGERRRACIIVELLTDPEILFLDEPTTGLDSKMALKIITNLQMLAKSKKKIIICSIHQPNSQMFFNFDKVLLLSHGTLIYFGFVNDISSYFSTLGFSCPEDWNIADFVINLLVSPPHVDDTLKNNFKNVTLENEINFTDRAADVRKKQTQLTQYPTSYRYQLKLLCKRSSKLAATVNFSYINFIKDFIISAIFGIVWFRSSLTDQAFNTLTGLVFYVVVNFFAGPLFDNIFQFGPESDIIRKEVTSNMYNLSAYYLSKVITEMPIIIIHPIIQWTLIYWMAYLGASAWYVLSLLQMCLVTLISDALGLLASSFLLSYDQTMSIASVYFVIAMLVGGFFIKQPSRWIGWLKYISPIYYSYILQTWIILLSNNGLKCDNSVSILLNITNVPSPFKSCLDGKDRADPYEIIRFVGVNMHPGYFALISVLIFVLTHIMAYCNLKWNLTRTFKQEGLLNKIQNSKVYKQLFSKSKTILL